MRDQSEMPTAREIDKIIQELRDESNVENIFPSVSRVEISTKGYGSSLELHITKREGLPIHLVDEESSASGAMAIKRVNELSFYSMNLTQLRKKVHENLSQPRALAIIWFLDIQSDEECFKEFRLGKSVPIKRYSHKALEKIRAELPSLDLDEIWRKYSMRQR